MHFQSYCFGWVMVIAFLCGKNAAQINDSTFIGNTEDMESGENIIYEWKRPPQIIGHALEIRRVQPLSTIYFVRPRRSFSKYIPLQLPIPLQYRKFRYQSPKSLRPLIRDVSILPGSSTRWCPNCVCGQVIQRDRVVDGIRTALNEYPWMVALVHNYNFFCSGSLINDRYILTAANCATRRFRIEEIAAMLVDLARSDLVRTEVLTRRISRIVVHQDFNVGGPYNNDIALFRLDQPVIFDRTIRPVCLPPSYRNFEGYTGIVTGWSNTLGNGSLSPLIQVTNIPIIPNYECRRMGYGQRITNNTICAGLINTNENNCLGENGGPLHVTNGSYYIIVGIVSGGDSCPELNAPEVFTRVNNYIPWIYRYTRDACYC